MVMRIGEARFCRRLADFDIDAAPQVAHIAPRHGGNLLLEELIFHLLPRRHDIGGLDHDLLVAAPDQFDARLGQERQRPPRRNGSRPALSGSRGLRSPTFISPRFM